MIPRRAAQPIAACLLIALMTIVPLFAPSPRLEARAGAGADGFEWTWTRQAAPPSMHQADDAPDLSGYPDAAQPELLAWAQVASLPSGPLAMTLEAVTFLPQTASPIRKAPGSMLLYVEQGRITVTINGTAGTFGSGSHAVVEPGQLYAVVNENLEPASAMVFQLSPGQSQAAAHSPADGLGQRLFFEVPDIITSLPELPPQADMTTLFSAEIGSVPEPPLWVYIAAVSWPPGVAFEDHAHSGPVGLSVVSGILQVGDASVEAGDCVVIPPQAPHRVGAAGDAAAPATAIMAGVFAVGEPFVAESPTMSVDEAQVAFSCGDAAI